ncbi:THUMP domain-containing protein 3 isoform X3 [Oopsacas minuta]|uniref:THUMP domain-containing protein 3 isoform X3 n=1 Tax=Oopsacas minuta TaxID=111878 RepID=A0AAV7JP47_9METZ|nr:THUMP domain-containing protein 3 isoform X3 [Oopsacas minuta]
MAEAFPTVSGDHHLQEASVEICATVPTGLEVIASEEIQQIFAPILSIKSFKIQQGKVFFNLPFTQVNKLKTIRSVENLYAIVAHLPAYCSTKEDTFAKFLTLPSELNWSSSLECWKTLYQAENKIITPLSNEMRDNLGKHDSEILKFRMSCHRAGSKSQHPFGSPDIERLFGGACQDYFGWNVNLKHFDVEIFVWIFENQNVMVGITLTKDSLAIRNIVKFGPTTLRPCICYCLSRTVSIKLGEVVIDPMCGSGSIPIEAAIAWPNAFYLGADSFLQAPFNTAENIHYVNTNRAKGVIPVDSLVWDATCLPLRTSSVDVILTDLPYGRRMGTKHHNWKLYPDLLSEFGRVCKPSTSRAALLTQDSKCIVNVLKSNPFWKKSHVFWLNHGGLRSAIYVLIRTAFML